MERCTIYYESWQLQCCGDPFSVGEKVTWKCFTPDDKKYTEGIILDFVENHHGFSTHRITGTIKKIIEERSECSKGGKEVEYLQEIQYADGSEPQVNDDIIKSTLCGYIVELEDVVVKQVC